MLARRRQKQWIDSAIINQLSKGNVFLESKIPKQTKSNTFSERISESQCLDFRKNRNFLQKETFHKKPGTFDSRIFFHLYFTDLREWNSIHKAVYRTHLDPITNIKLITKWNYLATKQFCLGWGRLWFWSHLQWFYISVIWFRWSLCCIKEERTWLIFSEWS